MQLIYARYNKYHIDITIFNGYLLRIDCGKAEHGLKVTPKFAVCFECTGD